MIRMLQSGLRKVKQRLAPYKWAAKTRLTPHHSAIEFQWIVPPSTKPGDKVCAFVTFARGGIVPASTVFLANAWADAGFSVIVVANSDAPDIRNLHADGLRHCGLAARRNAGYDFGAWASLISRIDLDTLDCLLITNDSVIGPVGDLTAFAERLLALPADVAAATESREFNWHLQSYCVLFHRRALRSPAFRRFWGAIRTSDRLLVILNYEIRMTPILARAGLHCASVLANRDGHNQTLSNWRELLDQGFPFVKKMLLRENPLETDISDWRGEVSRRGYDVALLGPDT